MLGSTKDPFDDGKITGIMRWLPAMVVVGVVVGFVALAWYAYNAGSQSVKDEDLLVVEADKTPVKEKPVDAGGMQIPNQDKTIFETFDNGKQPPKVERVLPAPEEPVKPLTDTSGTDGWINEKYHNKMDENADDAKPEQVISPAPKPDKKPVAAAKTLPVEQQVAQAQPAENPAPPISKAPENKIVPAPVPTPKEEKKPAPALDNGAFKLQLGAYRSEKEAQDAWNAMQKKHTDLLGNAQPNFIKADLGAKGIYYRLRIGGFASAAEAGALCSKLTAAGQQCIIPPK